MGYSGLFDGPLAPLVWICAILIAASAVFMTAWLPTYWRGGDGWFASRIEMATGTLSRYPSGVCALIPFVLSMWGFGAASIFAALMTVGGYGDDDNKFIPGMLCGVLIMAIGFLLQQAVVWFGRPRFLIPPRFRSIPGERRRRVQRRQARP